MSVELPRDAEGREIPLDTVALFGGNNNAYNITGWIYVTDFDLSNSTAGQWRALTDKFIRLDPELMYLTPPDSWEKLEEDLDSCSASTRYALCAYFSFSSDSCEKCPADPNKECLVQMAKHIALRIHKLGGES